MDSSCKSPEKSNMDDQRSRNLSIQEQLQELGLLNLKKTWLQENLMELLKSFSLTSLDKWDIICLILQIGE